MGRQSLKAKARAKAGAHNPSKMIAARANALKNMNALLRERLTEIEDVTSNLKGDNIRFYYRIGKICCDIKNNPDKYVGRNGESGLSLIQTALSTEARSLRKCVRFVECYPDDSDVEDLVQLYHKDTNMQLHWGHVTYLLTLDTPEQRKRWAETAIEQLLDPLALHKAIQKSRGVHGQGHGRKHELPSSIPAQVRQIHTFCRTWLSKYRDVWNGADVNVFANVINGQAMQSLSQELLDDLKDIRKFMGEISDAAADVDGMVGRTIQHVEQKLEQARADTVRTKAKGGKRERRVDLD